MALPTSRTECVARALLPARNFDGTSFGGALTRRSLPCQPAAKDKSSMSVPGGVLCRIQPQRYEQSRDEVRNFAAGWLGKTLKYHGDGKYELRAQVSVGDINLEGK